MRFVKDPSGFATALSAAADPSLMKLTALAQSELGMRIMY
jgi:hypothetical protein